MSGILVALQFLTRLPSPIRRPITTAELGPSMRWFPLVGAFIGGLVGVIDLALAPFTSVEVRSIAAVAALAILSGALHLDGFMDACDGLLAFTTPERRLEIMRDSHVGSFAIAGAATLLLLKYAAFLGLPAEGRFAAFVALGALSRWSMVYAAHRYPVARPGGLADSFKQGVRRRDVALATLFAGLAVLPIGLVGVGAFLAAWLLTLAAARYTLTKIPGLTGDVYGALCEIVEVELAIILPPLWRAMLV